MQIFTLLMATVEAMQMLIEEGTCSFTQEDEFLVLLPVFFGITEIVADP